jgi:hypothetical protein
MKLKRYLEFIKESLSEYNKKGINIWKLDNEDVEDMFIDFIDEGWSVTIEKGFNENSNYLEKIYLNNTLKPAYWITLDTKSETTSRDLTDVFKDAIKRLEDFSGGELIKITDRDWSYGDNNFKHDLDSIKIAGGLIYDNDDLIEQSIHLFISESDEIMVDEKMLVDYYNIQLEDSEFESLNKGLFVHVDLGTLASKLIKDDNWEKTITECDYYEGPINNFWDNYGSYYYSPDFISLIDYNLTKENLDLLIKSIIKETGGIDEIKRHIGDELDDEIYESVKDLDLEELIKFFKDERFYQTLKHFTIDSEIYSEINGLVADWESSAHAYQNYKEMINEFDNIVGKEFTVNRKFREERVYKSKIVDGKKVDYKQEMTIYEIEFKNEWIDDFEFTDLEGKSLYDLFYEYISNLSYYEFKPHFSDYGSVDSNKMNSEIKSFLSKYLK